MYPRKDIWKRQANFPPSPPIRDFVPRSEYIDLEPFSRFKIKSEELLDLWSQVMQHTLRFYHTNPKFKDIWETMTWGYSTIEDTIDAYKDLLNYLKTDFDVYLGPQVMWNIHEIIFRLEYFLNHRNPFSAGQSYTMPLSPDSPKYKNSGPPLPIINAWESSPFNKRRK